MNCENSAEREQLRDKLNKLRRVRACYLKWIYGSFDRFEQRCLSSLHKSPPAYEQ